MQKVGAMTATFSVRENKPKYVKSTYVPPHQRTSTVSKFENNKNGGKKHTEYTQSYKLRVLTLYFKQSSRNNSDIDLNGGKKCIQSHISLNSASFDSSNIVDRPKLADSSKISKSASLSHLTVRSR